MRIYYMIAALAGVAVSVYATTRIGYWALPSSAASGHLFGLQIVRRS